MGTKQLIPINQLVTIPEGISIPFNHLELADLSNLPRGITLVTLIGPSIKALITKGTILHVKLVYKISFDEGLARQYGVDEVMRAMSYPAEMVFVDQEQKKVLLSTSGASWTRPNEVTRQFELPVTMTGAEVLAAVRASDEFIVRTAEAVLVAKAKAQERAAQG